MLDHFLFEVDPCEVDWHPANKYAPPALEIGPTQFFQVDLGLGPNVGATFIEALVLLHVAQQGSIWGE